MKKLEKFNRWVSVFFVVTLLLAFATKSKGLNLWILIPAVSSSILYFWCQIIGGLEEVIKEDPKQRWIKFFGVFGVFFVLISYLNWIHPILTIEYEAALNFFIVFFLGLKTISKIYYLTVNS